ncbi:MAG: DUF169 domain-containing protein [Actinomycetota bacterium]|nr:DUF169 domain-containing protein [Actinomycetota bacterium]
MNKTGEEIEKLTQILSLSKPPVGIRFLSSEEYTNFDLNYKKELKARFCQGLNMAQTGKDILLDENNISCPAAAAAFGFKQLPPILSSGNMLYNMGLFSDPQTGKKMMEQIPRLELAAIVELL